MLDTLPATARPLTGPLPAATPLPGLLSSSAYAEAAAAWQQALAQTDGTALRQSFLAPDGHNIPFVGFPIRQIVELVSAPGVRHLKARFVLRPDADGQPRFAIALFAVDSLDTLISSYYVADGYAVPAPAAEMPPASQAGPTKPNEVPNALVQHWMRSRAAAEPVASQFATPYGPLRGYTFELQDFVNLLFGAQSFDHQQVRLLLVLHSYCATTAAGVDAAAQTLGLAVQFWGDGAIWGDVFDMAVPCPPGQ